MTGVPLGSSFRDPSGFVFLRDGVLYRQVNERHREHYDLLIGSGLYRRLVDDGLLVAHEEVDPGLAATEGGYLVLRPERVPFVAYPYEWCFGQLKEAALATLRIQRTAMDAGLSLRDASAYNIQFVDGRPVLIDTLSFERLPEGRPWVAYRQFCQHFLAPLALASYRDVRLLGLLRDHLDGIPLDLAAGLLPRRARTRMPLLLHLFLHARSQTRHAADAPSETPRAGRPFSPQAFRGLVDSLEKGVRALSWEPGRTTWSDYYAEAEHYPAAAMEHKEAVVGAFLDQIRPRTVWDLGANTGRLSRLASSRGIPTVAFDLDPAAVELDHREVTRAGETRLLPLVQDLANPSPALGWDGHERMSLAERGPADLAMALALVHHLAIGNNVPLGRLARTMRGYGEHLIVEWVPKEDPKVQGMLATREDVFDGYTRSGFEAAFAEPFEVLRREELRGTGRSLYLMRGR